MPETFVPTQPYLNELYQLAKDKKREWAPSRGWFTNLESAQFTGGGRELYELAKEVRGLGRLQELQDSQILPTFFTEKAIKILMTMPNRYWFWNTVQTAIMCHRYVLRGELTTIDCDSIQNAIRNHRLGIGNIINLSKEIEDLTIEETAYAVAAGIIVMDGLKRVRNPVFSKPTD